MFGRSMALKSRTQLTAAVLVKLARVRGLGHRLHFRDFRIRLAITRPCCMDHPEECLIIGFFNAGGSPNAT